jgi:hypothetical protein
MRVLRIGCSERNKFQIQINGLYCVVDLRVYRKRIRVDFSNEIQT